MRHLQVRRFHHVGISKEMRPSTFFSTTRKLAAHKHKTITILTASFTHCEI